MPIHDAARVMLLRGPPISIPVFPGPHQTQLVGRASYQALHGAAPNAAAYSAHECIGDISDVKPRAQRVCLFRRICLDPHNLSYFYYVNPNSSRMPVLFEHRYGHMHEFQHRGDAFIGLNKHVRYKHHVRWSPTVAQRPLPQRHIEARGLHLLSAPFVPSNLGHLVWEEAFPLLLAMIQVSLPPCAIAHCHCDGPRPI